MTKALELIEDYMNIDFGCDMSKHIKECKEAIEELEALELQHSKVRKEVIKPVCPKCGSENFITSTFLYTTEECRECGYYYNEGLE